VPHEVVGEELPASLKRIQQRHRPTLADKSRRTIHLDHGEPPAGGCNRIAFSCVSFLSNPQRVQLGLEGDPIDYFGRGKFICHDVCHRSLRHIARR
jgi:hypothetical protein